MSSISINVPKRLTMLAPWKADLIRLGAEGDGGYVIAHASLNEARGLISLGLAGEWSFDSDFLARRPNAEFLGVDRASGFLVHSVAAIRTLISYPPRFQSSWRSLRIALRFLRLVPPLPFSSRRRFVRRWVRSRVVDRKRDISIGELLQSFAISESIFLKVDIEGGEYDLIPEIAAAINSNPKLFSGICIEFHSIGSREADFVEAVQKLQSEFRIIHLHANNCVDLVGDFPDVIEVSFAPRLMVGQERVLELPLQCLDWPNDASREDYRLVFEVSAINQ